MKKIFLITLLTFTVIIVTGCGNKKITCTIETEEDELGYKMKAIAKASVTDGKIKEYDSELIITFDDEDLASSSYNIIVAGYNDKDMVFKQKGKKITGILTDVLVEPITKEKFIEEFESEGYTCK
jgi:hypothetical protein